MKLKKFAKKHEEAIRGTSAKSTIKSYRLSLRKFADCTGNVQIEKVTVHDCEMFKSSEKNSGLIESTVNNYLRNLKAAFNRAVDWGWLEENPFRKVKPLRQAKTPTHFLPYNQFKPFLDGITNKDRRDLITAYLYTGRRRCELLNLKWKDVDIEKKKYTIHSSKTNTTAVFPINDVFLDVLVHMQRVHEYVFPKWRHADSVTHWAKDELRKAGLGSLHLHSFRHSFASAIIDQGGDIYAVKELLGHSDIKMTQRYSHLRQEKIAAENNILDLVV